MRHLDDVQFRATFSLKMSGVELDPAAMADVLPAVRAIPPTDLGGFELRSIGVDRVYRADTGLFEHYLVPTTTPNVFLVLVRDRVKQAFFGYHVLNLNEKYGLTTPTPGGASAG